MAYSTTSGLNPSARSITIRIGGINCARRIIVLMVIMVRPAKIAEPRGMIHRLRASPETTVNGEISKTASGG